MPWYQNRKFLAPIFAGIVTILLSVLTEALPAFDMPPEALATVISFAWFSAVAILIGDIGYDWIGEAKQAGGVLLDYADVLAGRTDSTVDDQAVVLLREILKAIKADEPGVG